MHIPEKAKSDDFLARFREIISDPLNIMIDRVWNAGCIIDGYVVLHNGNIVPAYGKSAYYENFSDILTLNRGVHEPLEEFVFQELLPNLPSSPRMIELGAYWSHYSMWLKRVRPDAVVVMVEPETENIAIGRNNFDLNNFTGEFIQDFVGKDSFQIDQFFQKRCIENLTILHADIQGFELEMLEGSHETLSAGLIDYIFISTHSNEIHQNILKNLANYNYRIEIEADFDNETTSYDGFIFASNLRLSPIFKSFPLMGRQKIANSNAVEISEYINRLLKQRKE